MGGLGKFTFIYNPEEIEEKVIQSLSKNSGGYQII
jgi:hypothetical protein